MFYTRYLDLLWYGPQRVIMIPGMNDKGAKKVTKDMMENEQHSLSCVYAEAQSYKVMVVSEYR